MPHIDSPALAARTLPSPVLGNGDITTPQQAADVLRITPAGILIGRGAVCNPFITLAY
ncbi:MAG: tRNA-dihydrouridine synthase [Akkermansia sp.]